MSDHTGTWGSGGSPTKFGCPLCCLSECISLMLSLSKALELAALWAKKRRETTKRQQHGTTHPLILIIQLYQVHRNTQYSRTTAWTLNTSVCIKWNAHAYLLILRVSTTQRLPNGSIDAHDDSSRVSELQELLDRTKKELTQSREHSATLTARLAELEAELANTRRELSRSEELSIKQQREQREVRGGASYMGPRNLTQILNTVFYL